MARGWESKSVESQIEEAEDRARQKAQPVLTPEQAAQRARRECLLLDRTRLLDDLGRARHERHAEMLRAALAHIDGQLAELDEAGRS